MTGTQETARACSPGSFDVLLGRGTGPNTHSGNVRYRDIVQEFARQYIEKCESENDLESPLREFAYDVMHQVRELGGRFLELSKDRYYVEAPVTKCLLKVIHALRHQIKLERKATATNSESSSSLSVVSADSNTVNHAAPENNKSSMTSTGEIDTQKVKDVSSIASMRWMQQMAGAADRTGARSYPSINSAPIIASSMKPAITHYKTQLDLSQRGAKAGAIGEALASSQKLLLWDLANLRRRREEEKLRLAQIELSLRASIRQQYDGAEKVAMLMRMNSLKSTTGFSFP